MAVTKRIVALTVELCIFGIGKSGSAQSMCRMKCHPHPQKHPSIFPHLGKKICALMQTYAIQRRHRVCPLVDVMGQTLRRYGVIRQASDVFIEIAVVEFLVQSAQTSVDCIVTH
jgi:hypothetical protein